MLTLTITDPHLMTEDERVAVLAFARIRRDVAAARATIDPADVPDVGLEIPVATKATTFPMPPIPPAPPPPAQMDAAAVFGGHEAAHVPSVQPPLPAPPAAAPASGPAYVPAATAVAPSGGGPELDSKGLPWDHRIHAGSKGKNTDGGWKRKKNTPDEVIAAVEAELRTLLGVPVGVPAPPVGDATTDAAPTTFPDLMAWVAKMVAGKKLTQQQVVETVQPIGLSSVVGLGARPDLIPQVYAALMQKSAEGA